jgi:hypothetical protein
MTRGHFKVFTIVVFLLTAGIIGALVFLPGDIFSSREREVQQTRVVIPQTVGAGGESLNAPWRNDETQALLVNLEEGEAPIAVLTRDFEGDSYEEQIIAYRRLQEIDSHIFISYAKYNKYEGIYFRAWEAPVAATRPGTVFLYSEDLIGDGGICILISGMNGSGEQTLTIFRKIDDPQLEPFSKIAEFLIEGSIAVEEMNSGRNPRSRSLSIAAYGRDYESANIMDQIEVTYTYNQVNGLYEQSRMVKIPGSQIEQRRLKDILNGNSGQFEQFIDGLWCQGEGDQRKYVYFNTGAKELIFYNNNKSEEIFSWQDSTPTSYGLHINSRNVSLTKLRRTINVELASLESIRLRVYQDEYLRSGPNTIWDGSYYRLQKAETAPELKKITPYLEESYDGPDGKITFHQDGSFELHPLAGSSELSHKGQYVFFTIKDEELLELRFFGRTSRESTRETYKISPTGNHRLSLTRVRINTRGIQDLHEPVIELK